MPPFTFPVLSLIFAHLLADFVFQSDRMVRNKGRLRVLFLHSGIVFALSWLFLGFLANWPVALLVAIGHGLIDFFKPRVDTWQKSKIRSFWTDQLLHLALIVVTPLLAHLIGLSLLTYPLHFPSSIYLIGGLLLVVFGGSPVIQINTKIFRDELTNHNKGKGSPMPRGLDHAGKAIGYLERFLIFVLVLSGNVSSVAFLIAAKSIFRFGELKDSVNRHQAEYITIGTLASFSWAITIAYLTNLMMHL